MADDHFATWGDAKRFCEKYGANMTIPGDAWDVAEALLRAYEDGQKNPVVKRCNVCGVNIGWPHSELCSAGNGVFEG